MTAKSGKRKSKPTLRASQKSADFQDIRPSVEDEALDHDLIISLENTIEAQKAIIDVLNFEQHVLKQKKKSLLSAPLDMSDREIAEVKDFLAFFLEGYKQQQSDVI